ncbi:MarR family winged helix-turn-helix transcriptional regulator [Leekyejoonella antrihumi]|uniref:MarR family transcriptional regulator n=1 Tax=Leekyejoonella antrihumi TaxID=1660198 RepID=A0A563DTQ1_9MICO|nr:MarR family transcriptional regulator [Leekyejoonella antrihumi]TWP33303.1 MarR family transcriptional regulator [Leekyejoonella antrihumi]
MDSTDDLAMPFLLMSAFRGLVDAVHAELEAAGYPDVRAAHGFAMQAIGRGCTGVELAERLGVSKQAAAKTAHALERMGLISRVQSPRDRRERLLAPTARGEDMLRRSAAAFGRQIKDWRTRVGDDHVSATLTTLAHATPGRRGPTDLSDWV